MNTLEALHAMKEGLLKQGCKAGRMITNGNGTTFQCQYKDDKGNRCGIGVITPDDRIDIYADQNIPIQDIFEQEVSAGQTWCKGLNIGILDRAQDIHDHSPVEHWEVKFDKLIERVTNGDLQNR